MHRPYGRVNRDNLDAESTSVDGQLSKLHQQQRVQIAVSSVVTGRNLLPFRPELVAKPCHLALGILPRSQPDDVSITSAFCSSCLTKQRGDLWYADRLHRRHFRLEIE